MSIPDETPPCFPDRVAFVRWMDGANSDALAGRKRAGSTVPEYCNSCPSEYQAKMKAEGKCTKPKRATRIVFEDDTTSTIAKILDSGAASISELSRLTKIPRSTLRRRYEEHKAGVA